MFIKKVAFALIPFFAQHLYCADQKPLFLKVPMKPSMTNTLNYEKIGNFLRTHFPGIYAPVNTVASGDKSNEVAPELSYDSASATAIIRRAALTALCSIAKKKLDDEDQQSLRESNTETERFIRQKQREATPLKQKCDARIKNTKESDCACAFVAKILDGTVYQEMFTNVVESAKYDREVRYLATYRIESDEEIEEKASLSKYGEIPTGFSIPMLGTNQTHRSTRQLFSPFLAALNPSLLDRFIE